MCSIQVSLSSLAQHKVCKYFMGKILLALNDKESLLKYLANIPVELMSEVLAFSQSDGIECDCINLTIVYSTMRWWNMPMLYSFQSETKRKIDY